MSRLKAKFDALNNEGRAAFISFITAGDPDYNTSLNLLKGMPDAGVDIIELGMPFTDPSADGPAIDKAGQRALKAGACSKNTLAMVAEFRKTDNKTPIVLMGYYNPVYHYGIEEFCHDAEEAGVDGMIIVDLPPEEDGELREPANRYNIDLIRLATPTSDEHRIKTIVKDASGFIYYVAVAGVTGGKSASEDMIIAAMKRLKQQTDLPIAVGFGIRTPTQAATIAKHADAAVVGSAIVEEIANRLDDNTKALEGLVPEVLDFVSELANGVKRGRL